MSGLRSDTVRPGDAGHKSAGADSDGSYMLESPLLAYAVLLLSLLSLIYSLGG